MRKVFIIFICLVLLLCGCNSKQKTETDKINVVTTVFPIYDFVRAVGADAVDITLLIKPGSEVHSYDPTPSDIAAVYESDLFFYIGGESESWVNKILADVNVNPLALINCVDTLEEGDPDEEEHHHNHSHHHSADEHIWTSPENAVIMIEKITEALITANGENSEIYEKNKNIYIDKIRHADEKIKKAVEQSEDKFILVADRFPFAYFADYYGISYEAAFGGCAASTDISLKTMSRLVETVKAQNCKAAFYVEMSNKSIANALREETGIELIELHSAHNVTLEDFESGITYADIMLKNAKALERGMR